VIFGKTLNYGVRKITPGWKVYVFIVFGFGFGV
jgi:hypothetical protein